MNTFSELVPVTPPVPSPSELAELLELEAAKWPAGLRRFSLFEYHETRDKALFRAVSWDPFSRRLFAQRVKIGVAPNGSCLPTAQWFGKNADWESKVMISPEEIRFGFMRPTEAEIPPSCLKGLARRLMLVQAILFVDSDGSGRPSALRFNDRIIFDAEARSAAIRRVCQISGKQFGSYRPYLLELVSKFIWFGGGEYALLNLGPLQGGPGVSRVGKNNLRPGARTLEEMNIADQGEEDDVTKKDKKRRRPVYPSDLIKFQQALADHWAKRRLSFEEAYSAMLVQQYRGVPTWKIPTRSAFRYHADGIIVKNDLMRARNGFHLSAQVVDARNGQASDLSGGVIEILDVDGFVAKVFVAANIKGKIKAIKVTVIFAVSRLSGAILGYELALRNERAESFRRCIASAYLPKQQRALELGLTDTRGLLHGSIDAVFVDNGAGASEEVIGTACDQMALMRQIAPGRRGDLKGVGEGVNNIMINLMASETSAYTRGKDVLSADTRRKKAKARPIPLTRFERLLLRAINHYNLHTNKHRLRTQAMRYAGVGISPRSIFIYTQKQRRGDAARVYSQAEVIERFVPWTIRSSPKGIVTLAKGGPRYTSDELRDYFNEWAKSPGTRGSPKVRVKRSDGSPETLLWEMPNLRIGVLDMVDEDRRNFDLHSWKAVDLDLLDDKISGKHLAGKGGKSRGQISVKSQEQINEVERSLGNPSVKFIGDNVALARASAARAQDAERSNQQQRVYDLQRVTVDSDDFPLRSNDKVEDFETSLYASLGIGQV